MWHPLYLRRLRQDIDIWIERGWITPQNAHSIIASQEAGGMAKRFPHLLALLGAVLIGFAAISFVAANWEDIPKTTKLVLLIGAMWSAYAAAIWLERRKQPAYAQAALVAGLALFGANIVLIAQIYHISSTEPTWLLVWCLAALATAWALTSRAALVMSFLLASIWSGWNFVEGPVQWGFLPVWAAALALTFRLSWLPGFHLALLTLIAWLTLNCVELAKFVGASPDSFACLYLLFAISAWLAALHFKSRSLRFSDAGERYSIALVLFLTWLLQITNNDTSSSQNASPWLSHILNLAAAGGVSVMLCLPNAALERRDRLALACLTLYALVHSWIASRFSFIDWIDGVAFFALSAWLIAYGVKTGNRFAVNAGFVAFGAEALYIYFETLGTLLDTAIFFALGGVLLIGGSYALTRLRREVVAAAGDKK